MKILYIYTKVLHSPDFCITSQSAFSSIEKLTIYIHFLPLLPFGHFLKLLIELKKTNLGRTFLDLSGRALYGPYPLSVSAQCCSLKVVAPADMFLILAAVVYQVDDLFPVWTIPGNMPAALTQPM